MFRVKVYYQVVSPESASRGDFAETGRYCTLTGETIRELAETICNQFGPLKASSTKFHKNVWYETLDPEVDYETGNETAYTIHLYRVHNVTTQEELYKRLIGID